MTGAVIPISNDGPAVKAPRAHPQNRSRTFQAPPARGGLQTADQGEFGDWEVPAPCVRGATEFLALPGNIYSDALTPLTAIRARQVGQALALNRRSALRFRSVARFDQLWRILRPKA